MPFATRTFQIAASHEATRAMRLAASGQGWQRLPRFEVVHTAFRDAVAQAASFDGWAVDYAQLSTGTFRGSNRQVDLGGIELILEDANQVLAQCGSVRPGTFVFGVPLSEAPDMSFNGRTWQRSIAASKGGREFSVRASAAAMLLVSVDQDLLEGHLHQQGRELRDPFRRGLMFLDEAPLFQRFTRQLSQAMVQCHQPAFQTAHAQCWSDLREALLDLIVEVIDAFDGRDRLSLAEQNKVSVVHRARQHIKAHIDEPLQVIDICQALSLSRRTLQQSFQDVLGVNPQAYLRAHRLNGARHALLRGEPGTQVKDVVARWGFWHLSRFSAEYRALFGELPSDTLKRA